MATIIETQMFASQWPDYWTEEEFGEFAFWLSRNPEAGNLVKESGGCRKVRWAIAGSGKSGGARIIYFSRSRERNSRVYLLVIYAKNVRATIDGATLAKIKERLDV